VLGGKLTVTGTDLEVTVRTFLEVEVMDEGTTVIPARLAAEAVRKLPPGAVTMAAEAGEVEITGSGPRFRLRELNVDDFPQLPESDAAGGTDVEGDAFIRALAQVGVAASTDEARPILTGVLFEAEDEHLRLVATDSYRLAVRDVPGITAGTGGLVPYRALREVSRSIGSESITVAIGERDAAFRSERGTLTARLIEGTFPNYRQLLPETYPNAVRVAKTDLLDAIGRAALVAEDHIPVRLNLHDGGIGIAVNRQEVGEETEHVDADYTGEEMTIAFNPRYLTDGVSVVDSDEVILETTDPLRPGLLRGAEDPAFRYLLMPVRL
jgi:DNA polymerase-3 subunit beta